MSALGFFRVVYNIADLDGNVTTSMQFSEPPCDEMVADPNEGKKQGFPW